MFHRDRPEKEFECVLLLFGYGGDSKFLPNRPLYRKYDYGTTVFSALAQGLLTGKVRPVFVHAVRCTDSFLAV